MINEYCVAQHVPAADMDRLWALGWRHFGSYFFRYSAMPHDGTLYHVIPLRIELSKFDLSQSQTRVRARSAGSISRSPQRQIWIVRAESQPN